MEEMLNIEDWKIVWDVCADPDGSIPWDRINIPMEHLDIKICVKDLELLTLRREKLNFREFHNVIKTGAGMKLEMKKTVRKMKTTSVGAGKVYLVKSHEIVTSIISFLNSHYEEGWEPLPELVDLYKIEEGISVIMVNRSSLERSLSLFVPSSTDHDITILEEKRQSLYKKMAFDMERILKRMEENKEKKEEEKKKQLEKKKAGHNGTLVVL